VNSNSDSVAPRARRRPPNGVSSRTPTTICCRTWKRPKFGLPSGGRWPRRAARAEVCV